MERIKVQANEMAKKMLDSKVSAVPGAEDQNGHTEIHRLKTEIARLNDLVVDLTRELEAYRKAANIWAASQITEAELESYGKMEPGLPLEAFIGELERIAREA